MVYPEAIQDQRTFFSLNAKRVFPFILDFNINTWKRGQDIYLGGLEYLNGKRLGAIEIINPENLGQSFQDKDLAPIPTSAIFTACDTQGRVLFSQPFKNLVRNSSQNKFFMTDVTIDTRRSYVTFSDNSTPNGVFMFQFYLID